ncbi:MAG: PEP-CTERM sorting domain-containing protein [Myxococcota bacterium]|nr:PEP-CTERM sorting domain-containing protein [Myxococcota bacterium]
MLKLHLPLLRTPSLLLLLLGAFGANAITTSATQPYLLVGTSINDSVLASNFEIGANQSAIPQSGLSLAESFPPPNTLPVFTGISSDGNVAVVDPNGQFNFSDLDIYADAGIGVQCAGSTGSCNNGASNTSFNGLSFPANGLTGGVDFSALTLELDTVRGQINGLAATDTIDLTSSGGKISGGTTTINLLSGINVIDILTDTGGSTDFLLENANLVIDGGADSSVIFRIEDDANMLVSQSAIVVGDGGIGLDDVMFFSDKNDNDTHFNLSNVVVNGVSFWDLSNFGDPSEISFNNVQGCTQAVGNKLNTGQNVRLTRCSFAPVPEPGPGLLVAAGLVALGIQRRFR